MGRFLEPATASDTEMEALQKLLSGYKRARDEGLAPVNPALEEMLLSRNSEVSFKGESIRVPGLTDSRDDSKSQEITPEPFYIVKTCDIDGQKVFINMCGCSEVAAPGHWQNGVPPELEESFSIMESRPEDGMQNLRFSLSCSDYILSTDKQGKICKVYDVVFNLVVMRHSKVHKQLRTFLINMAMTWIGQKYNLELKSDFKLPKGKYKGDVVRKHHIRAAKEHLVTEIIDEDAELQPSFPLLIDTASRPSISQEIERSQNDYISDKPIDLPESGPTTQGCTTTIASNGTKATETISLHQEVSDRLLNVREDQLSQESFFAPSESNKPCDFGTNLTSKGQEVQTTKKNDIDIEPEVCTLPSAVSFEEKHIADELKSSIPSQDITMQNAGFLVKNKPLIEVKYLGCPVELVILCLSFPSCLKLKLQDFQIWTSNTKLYVEASSYDPIVVPLVFPTSPIKAKATFFELESILEVYLPFLTYVELLA